MKNARTLSLLFAFLIACAASPPAAEQPWRLEVTSSGGIAGKGAGSMMVDSTGAVTVTTFSGKSCPGRLSEAEMRQLADAVANAKPESWKAQEPVCCDRIEWMLVLDRAGAKHEVRWIDDPKIELPPDLRALTNALGEIRTKRAAECR